MKLATKLIGISASSVLWFIGGAAVTLGLSYVGGSKDSQHVYELRMYHVNDGKMDALIARFGDHTDAIFRRHHMKSIGFWRPQDEPYSQNLFVYILEHPRPYRQLLHGSDELFAIRSVRPSEIGTLW
jgi:NIPSNAP